ncbi:MAG TPA: hypothetical protein VGP55_05375 [Chitinophagaceae bacterium]|nr:hypothetical protein [Chitinophagaceae bacterium]
MSPKKPYTFPVIKSGLYDKLIKTSNGIEQKGASLPYASINGHMFSFLDKAGSLGLRLPEDARKDFLKKYDTTSCEAHGTVLKEYVLVPEKLFENTKELKKYFDISIKSIKA